MPSFTWAPAAWFCVLLAGGPHRPGYSWRQVRWGWASACGWDAPGRGSTFPIYVALAFAVVALLTWTNRLVRNEHAERGRREASPFALADPLDAPARVGRGALFCWLRCLLSVPGGLGGRDRPAGGCLPGKLMGGMVADRLGWLRVSAGALLLSLPLIAFSGGSLFLVLPGVLLFQSTMAVTLVAVYALMPRWPATAFGLPCLALVVGAFPTFVPAGKQLFGRWTFVSAHRLFGRSSRPRPAQARPPRPGQGLK